MACFILLSIPQFAVAKADSNAQAKITGIKEKVKELDHMDGFFDLYWDKNKGQLLLQVDSPGAEFIYQSSCLLYTSPSPRDLLSHLV